MIKEYFTTNEIMFTDEYKEEGIIGILPVYEEKESVPEDIDTILIEIEEK